MTRGKVTILGINGHIGHHVAKAFVAAGWEVTGFGRANRHPIPGVRFVTGDAENVADMRAAIGDSEVVVNALNLPYHQWDKGRMEAQMAGVIAALGTARQDAAVPRQHLQLRRRPTACSPPTCRSSRRPRAARSASAVEAMLEARRRARRYPGDHPAGRRFLRPGEHRRLVRPGHPARGGEGQGGDPRQAGRRPQLGLSARPRPRLRKAGLAPQASSAPSRTSTSPATT